MPCLPKKKLLAALARERAERQRAARGRRAPRRPRARAGAGARHKALWQQQRPPPAGQEAGHACGGLQQPPPPAGARASPGAARGALARPAAWPKRSRERAPPLSRKRRLEAPGLFWRARRGGREPARAAPRPLAAAWLPRRAGEPERGALSARALLARLAGAEPPGERDKKPRCGRARRERWGGGLASRLSQAAGGPSGRAGRAARRKQGALLFLPKRGAGSGPPRARKKRGSLGEGGKPPLRARPGPSRAPLAPRAPQSSRRAALAALARALAGLAFSSAAPPAPSLPRRVSRGARQLSLRPPSCRG